MTMTALPKNPHDRRWPVCEKCGKTFEVPRTGPGSRRTRCDGCRYTNQNYQRPTKDPATISDRPWARQRMSRSARTFTCSACHTEVSIARTVPDRDLCDPCRRAKRKKDAAQRSRQARANKSLRKRRERGVLGKYGITPEDYLALEVLQDQVCAICGNLQSDADTRSLAVDHCHDTKRVRGLLCSSCNLGIGYFKDDPDLLRAAITYLRYPPMAALLGENPFINDSD